MRCAYCGSKQHETKYCPKTWEGQGNMMKRRCIYCGSLLHNIEECPKTA